MRYNQLGATDMKLSLVSMGGATFGNVYGHTDAMRSINLIRQSLKQGFNYIETSPWYGQGSSEITIGKALLGIPRNTYYVGSKIGRYDLDYWKMFDFSAEKTQAAIDTTLQRMQLEYIDLIQIHDLTFALDNSIILRETLPALERAVRDGKVRYIGLADYDIELMQEIVEESDIKISSILSYSKSTLFDNRLQNHVKYFKDKGVGVINAAATGMGLLTNRGPESWHPASDDIKALCKSASDYCKEHKVELGRLATWYTLSQPDIDTHLCGLRNLDQMMDTIDVLESGLTDREAKILEDIQTRFFGKETLHWDTVELARYKSKLKELYHHKE